MKPDDLTKKRTAFFSGYKSRWVFQPGSDEQYLWCAVIDYLTADEIEAVLKRMEENHDFNNPNAARPAIPQLKRAVKQVKTEMGANRAFNTCCKVCLGNKGWLMIDYVNTIDGPEPCRNGTQGAKLISVPCQCEHGEKNRELHKIPKSELQDKAYAFMSYKQKAQRAMKPGEFEILKAQFNAELDEIISNVSHFQRTGKSKRAVELERVEASA
jgi:hypothetical protein